MFFLKFYRIKQYRHLRIKEELYKLKTLVRNNSLQLYIHCTFSPQFIAPFVLFFWQCIYMTFLIVFMFFLDQGGLGSDRMSDDSSKEAVSDSHPDTLTDPEFSDPPNVTSSPPHSGDEVRRDKDKVSKCRQKFREITQNFKINKNFVKSHKI